jgi:hypothetical protein
MAGERARLIVGSAWNQPGRGSNRMMRLKYGLTPCRSRKPVSMM